MVIHEGVSADSVTKQGLKDAIVTLLNKCVTNAFPNKGGVIGLIGTYTSFPARLSKTIIALAISDGLLTISNKRRNRRHRSHHSKV